MALGQGAVAGVTPGQKVVLNSPMHSYKPVGEEVQRGTKIDVSRNKALQYSRTYSVASMKLEPALVDLEQELFELPQKVRWSLVLLS